MAGQGGKATHDQLTTNWRRVASLAFSPLSVAAATTATTTNNSSKPHAHMDSPLLRSRTNTSLRAVQVLTCALADLRAHCQLFSLSLFRATVSGPSWSPDSVQLLTGSSTLCCSSAPDSALLFTHSSLCSVALGLQTQLLSRSRHCELEPRSGLRTQTMTFI